MTLLRSAHDSFDFRSSVDDARPRVALPPVAEIVGFAALATTVVGVVALRGAFALHLL